MKKIFIYYPHYTSEESKDAKYHIINEDHKVLCGSTAKKLIHYSSNGDAITLDWYKQNLAIDNERTTCKKCSKKALYLLESAAGIREYSYCSAKIEINRRLKVIYKIEDKLFNDTGFGFSQRDSEYWNEYKLIKLLADVNFHLSLSRSNSHINGYTTSITDIGLSQKLNSLKYGVEL